MSEHDEREHGAADRIEKVRQRAYAIWLDQGQAHGRDREHWLEAEREIDAEAAAVDAPISAPAPKAPEAAKLDAAIPGPTPKAPKSNEKAA